MMRSKYSFKNCRKSTAIFKKTKKQKTGKKNKTKSSNMLERKV